MESTAPITSIASTATSETVTCILPGIPTVSVKSTESAVTVRAVRAFTTSKLTSPVEVIVKGCAPFRVVATAAVPMVIF